MMGGNIAISKGQRVIGADSPKFRHADFVALGTFPGSVVTAIEPRTATAYVTPSSKTSWRSAGSDREIMSALHRA